MLALRLVSSAKKATLASPAPTMLALEARGQGVGQKSKTVSTSKNLRPASTAPTKVVLEARGLKVGPKSISVLKKK